MEIEKILHHWEATASPDSVEIISDGLINQSYKITIAGQAYFFQKINDTVFKWPDRLIDNHLNIAECLEASQYSLAIPMWLHNRQGQYLTKDVEGGVWRLGVFFGETQTYHKVVSPDMGWSVGKTFGLLDRHLTKVKAGQIQDTIEDFHSLTKYVARLSSTVEATPANRIRLAQTYLNKVNEYGFISRYHFDKTNVIHNDAKISNILWRDDRVHAIIDWDTIMPGHLTWELADLVRTSAVSVAEDHPILDEVVIDRDIFEGVVAGWKSEAFDLLPEGQRADVLNGILYIILEQAIRFLEDFLAGNHYYRCDYDDHNLIRARNQFAILDILYQDRAFFKQMISKA